MQRYLQMYCTVVLKYFFTRLLSVFLPSCLCALLLLLLLLRNLCASVAVTAHRPHSKFSVLSSHIFFTLSHRCERKGEG